MTWCSEKNEAVLAAAQEVLDALGVELTGTARRNALLAALTRLYAAGSKAGPQREVRNLERERAYGRAYVRNGHRPPTQEQIEAMKLEITRPFDGRAAIDGAAGE